ncbi:hypothetical protein SKAU_G00299570 [Synaphobranchus kaupii]|uniref:Uncharacterized protein n=1 Tax=Synaphobranchus kaupii TaxID=118154 RepID=A0A9Q1IMW3_SYNKA|nr:hypothetical protein SKAU_G00299570 [Synaphobranchus kaupii]
MGTVSLRVAACPDSTYKTPGPSCAIPDKLGGLREPCLLAPPVGRSTALQSSSLSNLGCQLALSRLEKLGHAASNSHLHRGSTSFYFYTVLGSKWRRTEQTAAKLPVCGADPDAVSTWPVLHSETGLQGAVLT